MVKVYKENFPYFCIDLVRILKGKDPDLTKGMDILRRHILKTKIKGYYLVAEISKNQLYHIHSILFYNNITDYDDAMQYFRMHRLRNKVDDTRPLLTKHDVDKYYHYMNKQFKGQLDKRIERVNYVFKCFEDIDNFSSLESISHLNEKNTIEQDIFLPDD